MTHEQLNEISNDNGGGLSTAISGKYTSVRHERARIDGKLTAGQAAVKVRKALNLKVSAKELVSGYKILFNRDPEWHHAGFYKPASGGRKAMGRTFFFDNSDVELLIARWSEVETLKEVREVEHIRQIATNIIGYYYAWDYDYSGDYGRKKNYKVLHVFDGCEADKPRNFTPCDRDLFDLATAVAGKKYYGWDEPTEDNIRASYERRIAAKAEAEKLEWKAEFDRVEREKQTARAFAKLDAMQPQFIAASVNFIDGNAAWYIYSRFIEGTPEQSLFSKSIIKQWIATKNPA